MPFFLKKEDFKRIDSLKKINNALIKTFFYLHYLNILKIPLLFNRVKNYKKIKRYTSFKKKYKFKFLNLFEFIGFNDIVKQIFLYILKKEYKNDHLNLFYENLDLSYKLDFLLAQAKLIKNNKNCSFVNFSNKKCKFIAKAVFNPSNNNPILNNIDLSKNIYITGPTHSGKTNFLKTVIQLNQLSFLGAGIVPAKNLEINPFKEINQNLIFPDNKEYSKNDLEVKSLIDIKKNTYSLNIFDEVLSGCPQEESVILAENLLTPILKNKNKRTIFTTHFSNYEDYIKKNKKIIKEFFIHVEYDPLKKEFIKKYKILKKNKDNEALDWWFKKDIESINLKNKYHIETLNNFFNKKNN